MSFFARPNATGIGFFGGLMQIRSPFSRVGVDPFRWRGRCDTFANLSGGLITTINFEGDDGLDILTNSGTLGTIIFDGGADVDTLSNLGQINTIIFDGGSRCRHAVQFRCGADDDTFDGGADADTLSNSDSSTRSYSMVVQNADTFSKTPVVLHDYLRWLARTYGCAIQPQQINTPSSLTGGADADTLMNSVS